MLIENQIVAMAARSHNFSWSSGKDVSAQTKKAQSTCLLWQQEVLKIFGPRFRCECSINGDIPGPSQKIDLVDIEERVAYELKSSPNNVHMEIYRDVFKALVFNERNPANKILSLVFIAPKEGIRKLGPSFPKDVQTISAKLGLVLKIREIDFHDRDANE